MQKCYQLPASNCVNSLSKEHLPLNQFPCSQRESPQICFDCVARETKKRKYFNQWETGIVLGLLSSVVETNVGQNEVLTCFRFLFYMLIRIWDVI